MLFVKIMVCHKMCIIQKNSTTNTYHVTKFSGGLFETSRKCTSMRCFDCCISQIKLSSGYACLWCVWWLIMHKYAVCLLPAKSGRNICFMAGSWAMCLVGISCPGACFCVCVCSVTSRSRRSNNAQVNYSEQIWTMF